MLTDATEPEWHRAVRLLPPTHPEADYKQGPTDSTGRPILYTVLVFLTHSKQS